MLEKIFHLKAHNTNFKTEFVSGLTTFLAMAYILAVNPSMLAETGMDIDSVFIATALSATIACIVMGIVANYPIALASGMGINAFFTYTVVFSMGYSWQAALAAVFLSGVIFLIASLTNVRKKIIDCIPQQIKLAIGAGIGFFIAFVGLKNAGIIVSSATTGVTLGNFTEPAVLLALIGILITLALVVRKVFASVFVGMAITAIIGLIAGVFFQIEGMPTLPDSYIVSDLSLQTFGSFASGFEELFSDPFNCFIVIFSFLFVDFFDTAGTLVAVGSRCGLINSKGELENAEKALLSDAIGTLAGAVLGTSTVTSFSESNAGVAVGGRTGLSACITGLLFFLSIFISPIVLSTATSAVTAPALIIVGILMAQQAEEIHFNDFVFASSSFITILTMVLTYSISNGIALGFITYGVVMSASGKRQEVNPIIWILIIIFIFYFYSLSLL